MLFCEGEERLGGFFRDEGQVDVFSGEGSLTGAAEQEQCFGEVDRPGVDGAEAFVERAAVAVRIVAGDIEKGLRDRQRGAQFVGGVGREPLLFGDLRLQLREHGVEGVGEFTELIAAPRQPDPVGERSARGRTCGVRDASQGGEHAAGENPPARETEHQQEHQNCDSCLAEGLLGGGAARKERPADARSRGSDDRSVGEVSHEDHPQGEQQGTCEHEEAGVTEGEFEAYAQTRGSIHGRLSQLGRLLLCRCGSRRRAPWR